MKIGWFAELTEKDRKVYWACFGGLALDSMDSTIFALAMPTLITLVGITHGEAGILSAAGMVGAALGGWGGGIVADRIGRVRALQITILWVSALTFVAACVSTFTQLLFVRFFQGIGYGGEAAIGGVLIAEFVAPHLRGRAAASIQSAYAIGYAVSVGLMPVIFGLFPAHLAWRVLFAVGIVPALLVIYIRKAVPEPPIFTAAKKRRLSSRHEALTGIFKGRMLLSTVFATCMSVGMLGGAYVMITWLPTYLRLSLGLPISSTTGYLLINILGSLTGPFLCGFVIDRLGRKRTVVLLLVLQALNVALYTLTPLNRVGTFFLGYVLGALQSALASTLVPTFSELYPTRLRATGVGFCISIGRGVAAFVPAGVGIIATHLHLATAMGLCAVGSYCLGVVGALLLKDVSGSDLEANDEQEIMSQGSFRGETSPQDRASPAASAQAIPAAIR